jgi:uncharacterized membrane protein YedE/YeeE
MDKTRKEDRSSWTVGGGLLFGLGIGFFFLPQSPFGFVGSMIAGLGLGLIASSIISRIKE